jgi:hypothetical protein
VILRYRLRLAGGDFSSLTADIFAGKGFGRFWIFHGGGWRRRRPRFLPGGAFHDWTGSYTISFTLSTLVLAVSDICIWLAAVPKVAEYDKRLWGETTR